MKNRIANLARAAAVVLGLSVVTVPAYCTPVVSFGTPSGGTTDLSTSGFSFLSMTGVSLATLVVSGDTANTNANGTWSLTTTLAFSNPTTFTIIGSIGSCTTGACTSNGGVNPFSNLGSGGGSFTLLSGTLNAAPTTSSSTSTADSVVISNATSLSDSVTFLSDLGLTNYVANLVSSTISGSGNGTVNSGTPNYYAYTAQSGSITESFTATPEPASFLLIGSGLLALGAISRKRNARG